MTKLIIQNLNDRFINNLALCNTNFCNIILTDISGSLYRLYYEHKFTHIILIDSLLDNECFQFIEEFGNNVIIYIYKDADTTNYKQTDKIYSLLSYTKDDDHKTMKIPTLINHELYNTNSSANKINQIVSFIDRIDVIPDDLQTHLYPQTNLPIKLFNNSNIISPQNLGLLSEKDKALLLQQSKYYLAITEDYVAEAWACGCEVLTIDDLTTLIPSKYKHSKSFQPYTNFLKGLVSAKK